MTAVSKSELIDHIGWDLALAFARWKDRFHTLMLENGCPWVAEARGGLIQYIGPGGIAQNVLVQKSGLTKQAVQQHLDHLTKEGVIKRQGDPDDARRKRVYLSDKGQEAAGIANDVKRQIETEMERELGQASFARLKAALQQIARAASQD
ncbi:MAG: MarR family winged helix-turn-helix transcriptional regulator [Paracoccaceae bacterium]